MPLHKVMDHTGDSRFEFAVDDTAEVQAAMVRFQTLVGERKYTAIKPGKDGAPGEILRSFDPSADIIFQPQLIGG